MQGSQDRGPEFGSQNSHPGKRRRQERKGKSWAWQSMLATSVLGRWKQAIQLNMFSANERPFLKRNVDGKLRNKMWDCSQESLQRTNVHTLLYSHMSTNMHISPLHTKRPRGEARCFNPVVQFNNMWHFRGKINPRKELTAHVLPNSYLPWTSRAHPLWYLTIKSLPN